MSKGLVDRAGFEPATPSLQMTCSTAELSAPWLKKRKGQREAGKKLPNQKGATQRVPPQRVEPELCLNLLPFAVGKNNRGKK